MTNVPESLCCLYTATIQREGGAYWIEVPTSEVEKGVLSDNEVYRVAVLERDIQDQQAPPGELQDEANSSETSVSSDETRHQKTRQPTPSDIPVDEGDVVEVEIQDIGTEGDGLAKIDGFAIFVPSGTPGDELMVEVIEVNQTLAHARALQGRQSQE